MRATIPIFLCLFGVLALAGTAAAADAEGCADIKLLPRLEGCFIQECSVKQHDSFDTAGVDVLPGTPGPLDANINSLTYSCPAAPDFARVRQQVDAAIHKAGFLNVAEDKTDLANVVTTTRKGPHWIRWSAGAEDGGSTYTFTVAVPSIEKFKPEACAQPQVLTLQKTCEIVECTSKAEDSAGLRTALKEQTTVAGIVQSVTLSCPAVAPAQALSAAEDELKKSGFEILFSDLERPENGWLTGRAGNHWVELVSGPDGDAVSYALTSIASGEVIPGTGIDSHAAQASEDVASAQSAPAPQETAPPVIPQPAIPQPAIPQPAAPEPAAPVSEPPTIHEPDPVPAPSANVAAPTPQFVPPKPIVEVPIQSTHDLMWSVSGNVVVNLLVDVAEDGTVTNVALTGHITKDVLKLESAARAAASRWRFEPARQDGRIVVATKIPVQLHFQGRPWQY
jgi:TonB family protein